MHRLQALLEIVNFKLRYWMDISATFLTKIFLTKGKGSHNTKVLDKRLTRRSKKLQANLDKWARILTILTLANLAKLYMYQSSTLKSPKWTTSKLPNCPMSINGSVNPVGQIHCSADVVYLP